MAFTDHGPRAGRRAAVGCDLRDAADDRSPSHPSARPKDWTPAGRREQNRPLHEPRGRHREFNRLLPGARPRPAEPAPPRCQFRRAGRGSCPGTAELRGPAWRSMRPRPRFWPRRTQGHSSRRCVLSRPDSIALTRNRATPGQRRIHPRSRCVLPARRCVTARRMCITLRQSDALLPRSGITLLRIGIPRCRKDDISPRNRQRALKSSF